MKNISIFNFGISFIIYYFMMFLAVPLFVELINLFYSDGFKDYMNERYFLVSQIYTYESVLFAFAGLLSFISAYFLTPSHKYLPSIFRKKWSLVKTFYISILLFGMGYIVKIPRIFTDSINYEMFSSTLLTPFLGFCLSPGILHILGLLLAIIGFYESRSTSSSHYYFFKRLLIFMFSLFTISIILVGGKFKLLAVFVFIIIIHLLYYPVKLIKILFILSFITIIVFKIDSLKDQFMQNAEEKSFTDNFDPYIERISQIQTFTQIVLAKEEPLYGKTFLQFFEEFKPAAIRENVINENEFGRKYHIIQNTDYKTGVATTTIGDLYLNFHLSGVLIGLFLLGMLYKRLFSFLQNASIFGRFALPLLWVVIIHGIESSIGILLYNIMATFFMLFIVHLFLIKSNLKVST